MSKKIINTITDLIESIPLEADEIKILPICHTSKWDKLIYDIIPNNNKLKPIEDKTYKEDLLFFFYGKAKYIPENDISNEYPDSESNPFSLIYCLDEKVEKIHRALVFDSGGFERYETKAKLNHFEFKIKDANTLKKAIKLFFTNTTNYINGKMNRTFNYEDYPLCAALREYCVIGDTINNNQKRKHGEQAITFEIQFKDCFNLHDSLIAAVVPDIALSTPTAEEQCSLLFSGKPMVPYNVDVMVKSYFNMFDTVKEEIKKYIEEQS